MNESEGEGEEGAYQQLGVARFREAARQAVVDARGLLCGSVRSIVLQCAVVRRMYAKILSTVPAADGSLAVSGVVSGVDHRTLVTTPTPTPAAGAGRTPSRVDSGLGGARGVSVKKPRPKSAPAKRLLPKRSASSPALRLPLVEHVRPPYNVGYGPSAAARSHNLNFSTDSLRSAPVLAVSDGNNGHVLSGSCFPTHPIVSAAAAARQWERDRLKSRFAPDGPRTSTSTRARPPSDTPYLSGVIQPYERFDFSGALQGFVPTLSLEPPSPFLLRALASTGAGAVGARPLSAPSYLSRSQQLRQEEEEEEDLYGKDLFELSGERVREGEGVAVEWVEVEDGGDDRGSHTNTDADTDADAGAGAGAGAYLRVDSMLSVQSVQEEAGVAVGLKRTESAYSMAAEAVVDGDGSDDAGYGDDGFDDEEEEEGGDTFALTGIGTCTRTGTGASKENENADANNQTDLPPPMTKSGSSKVKRSKKARRSAKSAARRTGESCRS